MQQEQLFLNYYNMKIVKISAQQNNFLFVIFKINCQLQKENNTSEAEPTNPACEAVSSVLTVYLYDTIILQTKS